MRAARRHGLPLSVRGGGHDWVGRALRDGGLVIDLTRMRDVAADPRALVATVVETLNGRICSMATTHELLSFSRWQGVSLAELVRRELAPYATRNNTEINGPGVVVRPEVGQVMAMVLHELTTNAAKYGALSTKNGRVSIRWDQRPIAHSPLVREWHETGGPPVVAPSKPSYGTSTIRDLIPYEFGGAVDLVLAPSGVRCRIELPADWLGNESQPVSEAIARAPSRII